MADHLINEFYEAHAGMLLRFCEAILHNRMINGVSAEDVVQKVTVKAWEKRHKLATHPNLYGWFLNACRKECAMLMRSNAYSLKHFGWPVPFAEDVTMEEQRDVLLRWLAHKEARETLDGLKRELTPLELSVYEQYYVQEKSAGETAESLGLKVNAVNDAARRIRKKAGQMKNIIFIFSLSPIMRFICSILSERGFWE